jgi:hypothetical protein
MFKGKSVLPSENVGVGVLIWGCCFFWGGANA